MAILSFRRAELADFFFAGTTNRSPPTNRLEALKGDLKGLFSIRVNDQWRVAQTAIDLYEARSHLRRLPKPLSAAG